MKEFDKVAIVNVFRPVYPSPAGLVTSADRDGKPNIITLGEIFNISISNPVIIGIAIRPATYSYSLIKDRGEFVVNIPTAAISDKVLAVGSISGRSGADKFSLTGLTPLQSTYVVPPLIGECPVNLECSVININTIGDHELILGNVLVQHVDAEVMNEQGEIDPSRLDAFSMIMGEFWTAGKMVQKHY